ncbi:J domain-containing protein [Phytohalomonas tamaricis]|uniref:J domain-containing protein n=1 Tax=Phytohalomonas tamaricis TaxID=2081032 RepID=UPI000D0BCB7E|nr:DnaJ domain-containing protein [Phytohalomonas tamaricis]
MAPAHFSSFELLLLKSRYQPDTAALLLLAWVFVNKRVVLDEDRHYLEALAHGYRHTQDLDTLLAIAAGRNLTDIQLAAEVLLHEWVDEQFLPFLCRAIGLATSDGVLSLRNHHILRFLADLSGVGPAAFARLFREITGQPLATPDDPSRHLYWQENATADAPHAAQSDTDTSTVEKKTLWQRWHAKRQSARTRRQQAREKLHQRQARERQEEARRQTREQQDKERRKAYERQEQQRQKQERQQDTPGSAPPPHYRIRLALRILELDEYASRHEIKQAYRRLAQRHHPDRFYGQSDLRIALASQRFQRIKDAYDYLMQNA